MVEQSMTKVPGDRAASRSWPPAHRHSPQPEAAHVLARWQHADDQLAAAHRFPGIPGGNAASLDGPAQALGHQIKHLHPCAPRPGQVGGHGPPCCQAR